MGHLDKIRFWGKHLPRVGRWLAHIVSRLLTPELYTKTFLLKATVGLLALVFWNQLASFYETILVQPVLSKVESVGRADLGFGLAGLVLLLWTAARIGRAYRPSALQTLLFAGPGGLYLFALGGETDGPPWQFVPFSVFPKLYYADILLVPLLGGVLLPLVARWRAQLPVQAPIPPSYLQDDAPVATDQPSRPDARNAEAQRLMEQLSKLHSSRAYAVGIVGQWGSGKTRFLYLLQQHLPAGAICIEFNPWLVESTAAIRKEFFTALKEGLGHYSGELAAELGTYAGSLATVADSTAAKAFKEAVTLLTDQPTLTEQFKKVNEVIGKLNRPIFVFLDDIDRLDKDEVLETLRIVRNTANFQRTVFVLAYDRAYVLEAVQRTNQANSSQYLDKIVQLEFSLPVFKPAALAEHTLKLVLSHLAQRYHAELTDLISRRTNERPARSLREQLGTIVHPAPLIVFYPELITTMRGAGRFASLFAHDFLPLAGEVPLDEFLNLTLLKLRFPALYDAVRTQRILETDLSKAFSKGGAILTLHNEKLADFLTDSGLTLHERQLAEQVVRHLFNKEELSSPERTIQRPSSFDLYFSAGDFTNASLVAIEQLRRGDAADIDSYLSRWQQAGYLEEVFEILIHIGEFNNRQDFENVVTAGLRAGRQFENVHEVLAWLRRLNAQRETLVAFYQGHELALATWLESLLAAAPSPYLFEAGIVRDLRADYRHNSKFQFILPDKVLGEIALDYLRKYLHEYPVVDRRAFELHWATVRARDEHNMVITDKRADELMHQALVKNKLGTLPALLVPVNGPSNEQEYVFQPLLKRIFGSWDEVQAFLYRLPPAPETKRIQQDFKLFQQANYQQFNRSQLD